MTVSTAIDASFVKHFEAEVHNAYQQQGSKLRNTVRFKGVLRAPAQPSKLSALKLPIKKQPEMLN